MHRHVEMVSKSSRSAEFEMYFSYSTPRCSPGVSVCASGASPSPPWTEPSRRHPTTRGRAVMAIAATMWRVASIHRRQSSFRRAGYPPGRSARRRSRMAWVHSAWSTARRAAAAVLTSLEEPKRWARSRRRRFRRSVRTPSDCDDTAECCRWPQLTPWSVRGSRLSNRPVECIV